MEADFVFSSAFYHYWLYKTGKRTTNDGKSLMASLAWLAEVIAKSVLLAEFCEKKALCFSIVEQVKKEVPGHPPEGDPVLSKKDWLANSGCKPV